MLVNCNMGFLSGFRFTKKKVIFSVLIAFVLYSLIFLLSCDETPVLKLCTQGSGAATIVPFSCSAVCSSFESYIVIGGMIFTLILLF